MKRSGKVNAGAHAVEGGAKNSGKRSKFNAQRVEADGIKFDSKHEMYRYELLKRDNSVRNIHVHVPLRFELKDVVLFTLFVDFVYERLESKRVDAEQWRVVYEDAKGYKKGAAYEMFKLKRRLIEAQHSIVIEEV